jgi:hypothetical protein
MDADYLRHIARRCDALSRDCFDLKTAERLRLLAEEIRARAAESGIMVPPAVLRDGEPEPEQNPG